MTLWTKKLSRWAIVALALLMLGGCTTSTQKLAKLSMGMSKQGVLSSIGRPAAVRGAITNKYGQIVEVWEYDLAKPKSSKEISSDLMLTLLTAGLASPVLFSGGEINHYWLYIVDERLVGWGQAGDWRREADRIYEIRF